MITSRWLLTLLLACSTEPKDDDTPDGDPVDSDVETDVDTEEPGPIEVLDERAGLVLADEGYGDGASRLVYLDQGWTPLETLWFYHADQGSVLLPRRVLLHLEQAGSSAAFLDPAHMVRLRFLVQRATPDNPDALPVGFSSQGDRIGLTCAACHTAQLEYNGVAMRIDGGQALLDMDLFLEELQDAMAATLDDADKLERYLDAATPPLAPPAVRTEVQEELAATLAWFESYNFVNQSDVTEGFGRIDAVGRIINQVIRMTSGPENSIEPDAPNSLPFLWDAPRHDYVQWAGFGNNAGLGSLGRNAGEVVGVFGEIDTSRTLPPLNIGYASTIHGGNLVAMEEQLWDLQSPVWPADILPPIDPTLAAQGREIYEAECASCHAVLDRDDEARRVRAQMYGLDRIGTDPVAAQNFVEAYAPTGVLEGETSASGAVLGATAHAGELLSLLVGRVLGAQPAAIAQVQLYAQRYGLTEQDKQGDYTPDSEEEPRASWLAYKARPLNGIWATAPYLHNGSVPTLYDLLLPPAERPVTFGVGRWAFDPVKVGPVQEGAPFTVDTQLPGNSNAGHLAGTDLTDEQRWALVEHLKTL
jgi:mono/diheme cytochrome c family protein